MMLEYIAEEIYSSANKAAYDGSHEFRGVANGLAAIGLGLLAIAKALEKKEEKDGRSCCDKSESA